MNRFTPDAMLGVENPEPLFERNRPLDQASIDRIKRPAGRDAILAQQAEEWPRYAGVRRPLDDAFWDRVGVILAFLLFVAVCAAARWVAARGGVIR